MVGASHCVQHDARAALLCLQQYLVICYKAPLLAQMWHAREMEQHGTHPCSSSGSSAKPDSTKPTLAELLEHLEVVTHLLVQHLILHSFQRHRGTTTKVNSVFWRLICSWAVVVALVVAVIALITLALARWWASILRPAV